MKLKCPFHHHKSSQVSTHQKKFENILHKAINTGQGMKQTNIVSVLMMKR